MYLKPLSNVNIVQCSLNKGLHGGDGTNSALSVEKLY